MAERARELQPYDGGAEAAVLSAAMLNRALLDELRDVLEPHDFLSGPHRAVFEAVLELDANNVEPDVVTVAHRLRATGKLEMVGGTPFLATLADATPTVANVLEHARIVRSLGLLRRMGGTLQSLTVQARQAETRADVRGFLERCEAEVFACNTWRSDRETASTLEELAREMLVSLDPSRPPEPRGISTGFPSLDRLSLGFAPGELWYVAARPGIGKTALALGMAAGVAETGGRSAVFFSLEMPRKDLTERLLSAMSGVHHTALMTRKLSMEQYENATSTLKTLARVPLKIDEDRRMTPSRLRSRARKHFASLRAQYPHARPGVLVVDYVQLLGDDLDDGNRNDQLERISRALKILAGELGVTVIALSQLNRPDKRAVNKRPSLEDLRGSGALEQDGDKILFIHRAEAEGDERGDAELILAKGRNVAKGTVRVEWQPWCVRFAEPTQEGFTWRDPRYETRDDD